MRVLSATSTIYLHVKQTEGTETANVSFDLGAATMEYGNNAPYFQWGRKDPMVPSTGLANANKPIYGTYTALNDMSTTAIAVTIRTPYYFNTWYNQSLELWNVGNTSTTVNINPVVKSIYDPSPIGFHIPCSGAFQGWDEYGRSYWQSTAGKQGRFFYQLGSGIGNLVFFPSSLGVKEGATAVRSVGEVGSYWLAGPAATDRGYDMDFGINYVYPSYHQYRNNGFTICPVAE